MDEPFSTFLKLNDVKEKYRSILVLNGHIPKLSSFMETLPIIAVDGGANQLLSIGIQPDVIIGDLDSLQIKSHRNFHIIYTPDQDYCDFSKALNYVKKNNLLQPIVLGISGGEIDHILQNINVFLSTESIFYSPPIIGLILQGGQKRIFKLKQNTKISLIGMPAAQISTLGLKWDLSHHTITFPGMNSCFNRSVYDQISIELHTGVCLAMVYLQFIDDAGVNLN